ncbi:MAG: metallophosphoesterase, partial [Candidatus Pacebacteria bacterium]|nr:metallophosphoesterase [Candidatus Paceibacterota bacterium]
MSRVFITGDLHGKGEISKLNSKNFPVGKELTKEDYVIILCDFGLVWNNDDEDMYWQNWLNSRNWTTLVVDGN